LFGACGIEQWSCPMPPLVVDLTSTRKYIYISHFPLCNYACPSAVHSSAGFLPLPPGLPVGIVVQSYAGVMSLSVTAEKWAVPDADRFLGWMLDEYRHLCKESGL